MQLCNTQANCRDAIYKKINKKGSGVVGKYILVHQTHQQTTRSRIVGLQQGLK